jgi:flavodoxin short chain
MKISIVYWSGTGNTEAMAKLIQEGAISAGAEVVLKEVTKADVADVTDVDVAFLGCPSMGSEELEEGDFAPFISSIEGKVSGKKLVLFGSYGWGDGQWMRDWEERMKKAGAVLVAESLIVNEAPDGDDTEKCKSLGKSVVA